MPPPQGDRVEVPNVKGMIEMAQATDDKATKDEPQILWTALLSLTATTSGGQGNYRVAGGKQGGLYLPTPVMESTGAPGMVRVVVMPLTEDEAKAEVARLMGGNGNGSGRA